MDLHATVGRGAGVGDLYVDLHFDTWEEGWG